MHGIGFFPPTPPYIPQGTFPLLKASLADEASLTPYPFQSHKIHKITEQASFGTGSTGLRLLRGNGTSHARNHDLCKGGAQDAAQMQPRERMQLHQPTHGTLLTHASPPRPFFGFFFFFFFFFKVIKA